MFDFDFVGRTLVGIFGESLIYQRGTTRRTAQVEIDRNLEIVDEDTGAAQYVAAATFNKADLPFDTWQKDDQIHQGGKAWRIVRLLKDDGLLMTFEVR